MEICPYTQCGIDIKRFKKTNKKSKYGGFGAVFEVEEIKTKKLYAAKIITSNYTENSLNSEIGILMLANHPTIIKFIGFSFQDLDEYDRVTIIMELAENGSLLDVLDKVRSNEISEEYTNTTRQKILIGISRGMKYLNDRKIIHRDLKPGNILINKDFHPLISDFGMSKFFKIDESKNQSKWGGSLSYNAPEVINGQQFDQKADVYSFAIIMYEVVTGLVPYSDLLKEINGHFQFQKKIVDENYRPIFKNPIKESFKELIEQCWSKEPDDRPTFSEIFKKLSNKDDEFGLKYFFDDVDVDEINRYIESITKIDDPIEELNHQIETMEKQNKQLKKCIEQLKNKNLNEESINQQIEKSIINQNNEKEDSIDQQIEKQIIDQNNEKEEETTIFKDINNVKYKLFLTSLTAEIIESPGVKGKLFIPTFINFNSKQFKVTYVNDRAFKNSTLESFEMRGKNIVINHNCFNNCQSLSKFLITKSGQIEFAEKQFIGCSKLEIISIQCSIVNIFQNQICNFNSLKNINIESDSQISFEKECFIGFNNLEKITLSGVNILIKDNCFKNCSNLTNIELKMAENLLLLSNVFQNCTKLIEINFKVDFKLSCGKDCFYGSSIKKANFQSKLVKLGESCFENHFFCKSLIESVILKSENLIIGNNCFNGCSSLKELSIESENEPNIGIDAFYGCPNYHPL